jgi:hypothetical protein
MFGRKKSKPQSQPYEDDGMMALRVEGPEEAWKVLMWVLNRVHPDGMSFGDYTRSARVLRTGDHCSIHHADGSVTEQKPYYSVEFPREIWERAKKSYTYAYAEKKVHEEIFGKGK